MTAPQRLSEMAAWRRWERMAAADPNRPTTVRVGEDGACEPDCPACETDRVVS